MTKRQLANYEKALLNKLTELQKTNHGTADLAVEPVADSLDATRQVADRDVIVDKLNRGSELMTQVRSALQRIKRDEFGHCLNCADDINPKRLAAVPWTPLCITCQGLAEKEKAGYTLPAQQAFA